MTILKRYDMQYTADENKLKKRRNEFKKIFRHHVSHIAGIIRKLGLNVPQTLFFNKNSCDIGCLWINRLKPKTIPDVTPKDLDLAYITDELVNIYIGGLKGVKYNSWFLEWKKIDMECNRINKILKRLEMEIRMRLKDEATDTEIDQLLRGFKPKIENV